MPNPTDMKAGKVGTDEELLEGLGPDTFTEEQLDTINTLMGVLEKALSTEDNPVELAIIMVDRAPDEMERGRTRMLSNMAPGHLMSVIDDLAEVSQKMQHKIVGN